MDPVKSERSCLGNPNPAAAISFANADSCSVVWGSCDATSPVPMWTLSGQVDYENCPFFQRAGRTDGAAMLFHNALDQIQPQTCTRLALGCTPPEIFLKNLGKFVGPEAATMVFYLDMNASLCSPRKGLCPPASTTR